MGVLRHAVASHRGQRPVCRRARPRVSTCRDDRPTECPREGRRRQGAAVVVDHHLVDDQMRRLVVVGDRAGLGLAVRHHDVRAGVVGRVVTHDWRLGNRVRPRVLRQRVLAVVVIAVECENRRRRVGVEREAEVARLLRPAVVVDDHFPDNQRPGLVVVGDRAGLCTAVGQHDVAAIVVGRGIASGCRFGDGVGPGVLRQRVLAVVIIAVEREDRRGRVSVEGEAEVACLLRPAAVVDDQFLDDQRARLVVVRDRARFAAGQTQGDDARCVAVAAEASSRVAAQRRHIFADGICTRCE